MKTKCVLLSAALVVGAVQLAAADIFSTIDYPGATSTTAYGINNSGDIVGYYTAGDGLVHGFLLSMGSFTAIGFPEAKQTWPTGINNQGDVTGYYNDGQRTYGFVLRRGTYRQLDCPQSRNSAAFGINSSGDVAGYVYPASGAPALAVLWRGGMCNASEYRADVARRTMTMYFGVSDAGVAVGHWATNGGSSHGIVYSNGKFTQMDYGSGGSLINWSISNSGLIAGKFSDSTAANFGFIFRDGHYTPFRFPDSRGTQAFGVNDSGIVVGQYTDQARKVHGYVATIAPAPAPPPVITVDDDGRDCGGAVRTIQEAVSRAVPGTTILVCRGTYVGMVNIAGPEKSGIRLIAVGAEDEVVLQGDYSQRDGFHLENVSNVLIRGFTVRDFGVTATTASAWGNGNQIYLQDAHYNTIENNRLINGDMMGIMLVDSGNNIVQNNAAFTTNSSLANCGIHIQGTKSVANMIWRNITYENNVAGIMMRNAGTGNNISNNIVVANGRFGIDIENTNEIIVEGNRTSYNRGYWGTTPGGKEAGAGITLLNVSGATVFDNRSRANTGIDLSWDGKGENRFESNACQSSIPADTCLK